MRLRSQLPAAAWTATVSNGGKSPVYQFSVGAAGGPVQVVRDFSPSDHFSWAPRQEGSYNVQVTVNVLQPPGVGSDLDQDMVFQQPINFNSPRSPGPLATDLSGHVVWYYDVSQSGFTNT